MLVNNYFLSSEMRKDNGAIIPEIVLNFFSRFPKSHDENEILKSSLQSKVIQPGLIAFFAGKFSQLVTQKDFSNDGDLTQQLLEFLLNLLCRNDGRDFELLALDVYHCFEHISSYGNIKKRNRLELSGHIYLKAYNILKNIISENDVESPGMESLLQAAPHIINHRDFSADQQLQLIAMLKVLPHVDFVKALNTCSQLDHASHYFHSSVVTTLLDIVQNKKEPVNVRRLVIENLPFDPNFVNVYEESRSQATNALMDIMRNCKEPMDLRKCAAVQLSNWVWIHSKYQYGLSDMQKDVIDGMIKHISDCGNEDKLKAYAIALLFKNISFDDPLNPTAKYLLGKYMGLLEDDKTDFLIKVLLSDYLPKGYEEYTVDQTQAIDLFFFMLEKLSDKTHPLELSKLYLWSLITCYSSEALRQMIGKRNASLSDLEAFKNLEIFTTIPELGLTAKFSYSQTMPNLRKST